MSLEKKQDQARAAFARMKEQAANRQQERAGPQRQAKPPALPTPALQPGGQMRRDGDAAGRQAVAEDKAAARREALKRQIEEQRAKAQDQQRTAFRMKDLDRGR